MAVPSVECEMPDQHLPGNLKMALVTTTIHVPTVLRLYRAYGPDVQFFVIGDLKTPHEEVQTLCDSLGKATYYAPALQKTLGYACSELIGWNSIQRRNIGFLEALKWGADIIVSVDDDNSPMDPTYFYKFWRLFFKPFSGLCLGGEWFDAGCLLDPPVRHRGFPFHEVRLAQVDGVAVDVKIGVAAGLWTGDPDIGAVDRISQDPTVRSITQLGQSGIVVHPRAWTVFNSQNTAFRREFAPAMMMWPGVGRYDDIFASLLCQKIMRLKNMHVHFGPPFVYQQRNEHDLLADLKAEMWGMEYCLEVAEVLDAWDADPDQSVLAAVRFFFDAAGQYSWFPSIVRETGLAWVEDCQRIMER